MPPARNARRNRRASARARRRACARSRRRSSRRRSKTRRGMLRAVAELNRPLAAGAKFPPIADYGFLSDCETAALVAPDGAVEWLCVPRFDSPSVLGAILDRRAGALRFGPSHVRAPIARRYLPGSNVLESDWMGEHGWLVVQDALAVERDLDEPSDCIARR